MKIYNVSVLDSRNKSDKTNFTGARLPVKFAIRKVPEQTLKNVSAAIAATGIASLMMGQSNEDYVKSIAISIDRLNLNDEDMQALESGYKTYPTLMDTLLSTTGKNNELRRVNKNSIEKIIQAYELNPDLTENLLNEKGEKDSFKYKTPEIYSIVNANEINPELLEISKKYPTFVNSLLSKTNDDGQPCFGVEDVKKYCEARGIDRRLAERLSEQHSKGGNARFDGATALFIVENQDNEFVKYLYEAQNYGSMRQESVFRLSGEELYSIYSLCETDEQKELAKKLLEVSFSKSYDCQGYLKPDEIVMIMQAPLDMIATWFSRYHDKEKLNKIIETLNKVPTAKEFASILHLENEFKQPVFSQDEIKKMMPARGTVLATQIIAERNLSELDRRKVIYHSIAQPTLFKKVMKLTSEVYNLNIPPEYQLPKSFKFDFSDAVSILDKSEKQQDLTIELLKFIDRTNLSETDMSDKSKKITSLIIDCLEMAKKLPDWWVGHLLKENLLGKNKDIALCGLDEIHHQMSSQIKTY